MPTSRVIAAIAAAMTLGLSCGTGDAGPIDAGPAAEPRVDGAGGAGCDSAAVAATLAPGATFDHEPTGSPAELAATTIVAFHADLMTVELGRDWTTVTVGPADIVDDDRDHAEPITTFGTYGSGVEDRPDLDPSALDGLRALVFAHPAPDAPGGLVAAVEGFWLQCPGQLPVSVIATPTGESWSQAASSLDAIVDAIEQPPPAGETTIQVDRGEGWRLVYADPGYGHPHEVAVMASPLALERAEAEGWFRARPEPDFEEEIAIVLAPAVSGSCPGIVFDGLTITGDRVFGRFQACTAAGRYECLHRRRQPDLLRSPRAARSAARDLHPLGRRGHRLPGLRAGPDSTSICPTRRRSTQHCGEAGPSMSSSTARHLDRARQTSSAGLRMRRCSCQPVSSSTCPGGSRASMPVSRDGSRGSSSNAAPTVALRSATTFPARRSNHWATPAATIISPSASSTRR